MNENSRKSATGDGVNTEGLPDGGRSPLAGPLNVEFVGLCPNCWEPEVPAHDTLSFCRCSGA